MKIYLVQGNCGEYSDYTEWVICAYRTEALAKEHARLAKEWRQEHVRYGATYEEREKMKNPYDDSYYGTDHEADWTAYGVEVRASLPTKRRPLTSAKREGD